MRIRIPSILLWCHHLVVGINLLYKTVGSVCITYIVMLTEREREREREREIEIVENL